LGNSHASRIHSTLLEEASRIDPAAGIILHRKVGDTVRAGDPIAELHVNAAHAAALPAALDLVRTAVEIGPAPPPVRPLILDRL
jgi:thymidine phosphorylase